MARKLGRCVLRPYREPFTPNCEPRKLAMKLASSEAASPSELVITIRYLPRFSAGVTIFSVFISTSVIAADLPSMVALTPALKPLPRMVKVARPDEEPPTGAIVPIPSGTRASWTIGQSAQQPCGREGVHPHVRGVQNGNLK
jgi:hypothetical protein